MFTQFRPIIIACAVILAVASPAAAQWLCDQPTNLTANCAFDAGIGGWTFWSGVPPTYSADGNYAPGSIEIPSNSEMGYSSGVGQCINGSVGPAEAVGGLWVRNVSGPVEECYYQVYQYSSIDCVGFITSSFVTITDFPDGWNRITGSFSLAATSASMEVYVGCYSNTDNFTVRFDDIHLVTGISEPIFADGFEHGNRDRWSQSTAMPSQP